MRTGQPGRRPAESPRRRFGWIDVALIAVTTIWAVNFSVVKATLAYIPPLAFNVIRLIGSSAMLLALSFRDPSSAPGRRTSALTRPELARIFLLGAVGHTLYQFCFIFGVDRTTAANSSLLLGITPVAVGLLGLVSGVEKPSTASWVGVALSSAGVCLVMSNEKAVGASTRGDLLILSATLCWSIYTVGSKPLLERHSPIKITAYTMTAGTALFVPFGLASLAKLPLSSVPWAAWAGTAYSFIFALAVAYGVWYYAVSRVGPTRTAVYSNLTPATGMLVAWLALGEPLGPLQLTGAVVILLGIHLVRRSRVEVA